MTTEHPSYLADVRYAELATAGVDEGNELTVARSKINFGDRISCTANVQLHPVTFTMRDRYWRQ